jgi:GT2 family glycosyltransferase
VPSRLEDAPIGLATAVIVAEEWPDDLARLLASLTEHGPDGLQVVVVANDPSPEHEETLATLDAIDPGAPGIETEVVWTSARLGHAAALNAGITRAAAEVVVLFDSSVELTGDAITPLVRWLDDESIAVVGPFGIVSDDLRHFQEAEPGDVDAIEAYCLAFRRSDYAARGPLDEHFRFYRNLDIWWSLVLRDEGPDRPPRRALALAEAPLERHEHRGWTSLAADERDRLSKRNFYRILDRFRDRRDLLVGR